MLQIQPRFAEKEKWQEFAKQNSLKYEILEFSSLYLNDEVTEEMISWYKKSGMATSLHGAFMDNYPVSPDKAIREVSRRKCELSCRQAIEVGAKNVVFHSTALTFVRKGYDTAWGKDAAEYYGELADRFDLNIFIENFVDVDDTPLLEMVKNIRGDRLGICLDIGHANYTRMTLDKWFEELGDHIGYIHLSDNTGKWDDHDILGEGTVDYITAGKYMKKMDKDIPVTIEVPTLEGLKKSIEYLKSVGII